MIRLFYILNLFAQVRSDLFANSLITAHCDHPLKFSSKSRIPLLRRERRTVFADQCPERGSKINIIVKPNGGAGNARNLLAVESHPVERLKDSLDQHLIAHLCLIGIENGQHPQIARGQLLCSFASFSRLL